MNIFMKSISRIHSHNFGMQLALRNFHVTKGKILRIEITGKVLMIL